MLVAKLPGRRLDLYSSWYKKVVMILAYYIKGQITTLQMGSIFLPLQILTALYIRPLSIGNVGNNLI